MTLTWPSITGLTWAASCTRRSSRPAIGPKRQVQQLQQEVIIDNAASQRFTVIEVYAG